MIDYADFLTSKAVASRFSGFEPHKMRQQLKPFQRDLVRWSLRKGRSALFTSTGTGKTFMQLEWANQVKHHSKGRVLILAPLSVVKQTMEEAKRWGYDLDNIDITNYEQLHKLKPEAYAGIVLDESSILKNFTGKTRNALIQAFVDTPYRLACTATPAPNDIAEIANHAEFLGIKRRVEMLAEYFVHDDEGWRLKGHAARAFYKWLASWSMSLSRPSDLGYDDAGYDLPPLSIHSEIVATDYTPPGQMFALGLHGIQERASVRKLTTDDRIAATVALVAEHPNETWLIWCGLNDEQKKLEKAFPDAVSIAGDTPELSREIREGQWRAGKVPILITKPAVYGFGMNWQHCHRMAFVGLGDSYETYYQAIRRCWRYGQEHAVQVHIVLSELEQEIYENVLRKEREATHIMAELIANIKEFEQAEVGDKGNTTVDYLPGDSVRLPNWMQGKETRVAVLAQSHGASYSLYHGDSAEVLAALPDDCLDLSVTSIPFSSLYTYSPSDRDLGNSRNDDFWTHMQFITKHWLRATKPGRNICVHVQQLSTTLSTDGVIGIRDFRGETIRHYTEQGFIFHGEVTIDKDPQAQAIRTHSKSLLFVQLHKDSSWMRPAFADYILIFRKPGDNQVPVTPDLLNEEWIEWARPIWYGIRESDTLNVAEGRGQNDERHICPLQLGTIERCIRLWSNVGEVVFDPFSGLGSVAYQAVKNGRKGVGIELNPNYYRVSIKNLEKATFTSQRKGLFDE